MINTTNKETKDQVESTDNTKKPDDYSSMYIRNFLKITDPESGQTLLETSN
jgi:hypothetical protein